MGYQEHQARALSIAQIAWTAIRGDGGATAAADWLVGYVDDSLLARALPGFVEEWAGYDFNAAGEWLGKLPPSATRDAPVAKFCHSIQSFDPEAAKVWAATIQDKTLRDTLVDELKP